MNAYLLKYMAQHNKGPFGEVSSFFVEKPLLVRQINNWNRVGVGGWSYWISDDQKVLNDAAQLVDVPVLQGVFTGVHASDYELNFESPLEGTQERLLEAV